MKGSENSGFPGEPLISSREQLFGKWSGKVPVQLLQEFIQKQPNWLKPIYNFNQHKGLYQCKIVLSKKNKKTSEIETVTYYPFNEFYSTKQEAKHSSATYVLHRLQSDKNIHTLLPPSQRDLWQKYAGIKADKDPDIIHLEYTADPWETALQEKLADKAKADKAKADKSNPWDEYPEIHIPRDLRERLEKMIRDNLDMAFKDEDNLGAMNPGHITMNPGHVKQILIKKGFREAHVDEVLQHRSDLQQALDWLGVHVPEDDLPQSQRPKDSKSIILSNQTPQDLSRQYIVDRLKAVGFSRADVVAALENCDWHEYYGLVRLCHDLSGEAHDAEITLQDGEPQSEKVLLEENAVLESIYDNVAFETNDLGHKFYTEIESLQISILIPHGLIYPHQIPGISIISSNYPAYIRLALLQKVIIDASIIFRGSAMVYSILTSIEEHLPALLENPPPLTSLYLKGASLSLKTSQSPRSTRKSFKPKKGAFKSQGKSNLELYNDFLAKKKSPAYQSMLAGRKKLPSYKYKFQITATLAAHRVLIICGETGCGKSTQIGQFILEDLLDSKMAADCFIICTQPRRISATSLAERVANEMSEPVGGLVGYSIKGESKQMATTTKLLFCTTGVLLRMAQDDTELMQVSHVIIDEVHERASDSDFLLVLLRDLLARRADLKVVLMSATIDATIISSYFGGCPVLEIPGRTFPVTEYYLEDILQETGYQPENTQAIKMTKKDAEEDNSEWAGIFDKVESLNIGQRNKLIATEKAAGFRIDYGLIAACVKYICDSGEDGAILIFVPGVMEVKNAIMRIRSELDGYSLEIMPLHSMLTSTEQSKVFQRMPPSKRKVVVSTNIAETSVTIDDVVFCIDTGRVKEMKLVDGILSLQECWASKAACKQRKGRAGRVRAGQAYKLYSSYFEQNHMADFTEPEMLRMPLEQLCLQIKAMDINDTEGFLLKAMSRPPIENIRTAIKLLEDINALGGDGRLTPLGRHISRLPCDVRVAKMLVFGTIFECLDPILTIAAVLSGKGPFNSPIDQRDLANQAQRQFYRNSKSDFFACCAVFEDWAGQSGRAAQRQFCLDNFLSMSNLVTIADQRKQFMQLLSEIGFASRDIFGKLNRHSKDEKIVQSVVLAGLFPNVAIVKMPKQLYDKTAEGSLAKLAESKEIRFFADNQRVFLHPSSMLFTEQRYQHDQVVLVYATKVATSKVFLRDCSVAPTTALLLLGGAKQLETLHGGNTITINNMRFKAFPRITSLIWGMKKLIDLVLSQKLDNPEQDVIDLEIGRLVLDLLLV